MKKEEHETILNTLLDPELEQSKKTEMLNQLRQDYDSVLGEHQELTDNNTTLKKNNDDLIISNSQLFRQIGDKQKPEDDKKEEEQQEFSETVNIEELEKGAL